jgi:hypothetical protein
MHPSEMLKKKIKDNNESKKSNDFFQRGRVYCVDEILLGKLYDVFRGVKKETNINDYEEKKEIKFAYPGIFSFEQQQTFYKVTKKQ